MRVADARHPSPFSLIIVSLEGRAEVISLYYVTAHTRCCAHCRTKGKIRRFCTRCLFDRSYYISLINISDKWGRVFVQYLVDILTSPKRFIIHIKSMNRTILIKSSEIRSYLSLTFFLTIMRCRRVVAVVQNKFVYRITNGNICDYSDKILFPYGIKKPMIGILTL